MKRPFRFSRRPVILLAAALFSASTVRAESFWSGWASSSDWNVNGHRTMSRSKDGIKRAIEGDVPIEIHDGQVTKLPDGAVLKLEQTGGPQQRQAELRGSPEAPALWIKDDKGFHAGGEADQKWLKGFLAAFEKKSAESPAPAAPVPAAAEQAAFSGTDPDSPLGVWHWFVGRDETFHPDGTVTYPENYATWKWVDQAKRTLVVEWKTLPFVDHLTLSQDGKQLTGTNNAPADRTSNTVTAERVVSPLGTWKMRRGADVTFREDHAAAFDGVNSGFWYWVDETKRQLRVEWSSIPFVDTLTVSEDGNAIRGTNHKGDVVAGRRLTGPLPVPPPGSGEAEE